MAADDHSQVSLGNTANEKKPICLCLSGGGFRATFFHLGVLTALRQLHLLASIGHVVSVSGGSIVAGHLACYWNDYDSDNTFNARIRELLEFGHYDLRGRIVRRMMVGGWLFPSLRRRQQLVKHYSRLFDNRAMEHTRNGGPVFHFLATSMSTGRLWSFSHDEIVTLDPGKATPKGSFKGTGGVPLSLAVAASSAFPPLFPPIRVTKDDLHATQEELPFTEFLTDGGVFDNVGVCVARQLTAEANGHPMFVVESDASSPFDWRTEETYWGTLTRNIRATGILMNRVAVLEQEVKMPVPKLQLSIQDIVRPEDIPTTVPADQFSPQPGSIQKMVRFIRTDLDFFDHTTITTLVRHGHEVALKELLKLIPNVNVQSVQDPCPPGWPNPLVVRLERLFHALDSVGELSERIQHGFANPFTAPDTREKPKSDIDSITELKLTRASHRSLVRAFWNSSDPLCWLLALVSVSTVAILYVVLAH